MSDQPTTTTGERILQRVVLPEGRDLDVLVLYVEGAPTQRGAPIEPTPPAETVTEGSSGSGASADPTLPGEDVRGAENIAGRRSVGVPGGRRLSFGTYFNAFPASYWRRWTTVQDVTLRVQLKGQGTLIVYRSTSKGHMQRADSFHVDNRKGETVELKLSLKPFIDGGWYWFDIAAGERGVVLQRAEWVTQTDRLSAGRVTIGITTFNRPDFCVQQLLSLAAAQDVLAITDEVLIVDQGTQLVSEHPQFAAASEQLGGRLRVIRQGNIGGSGGFSRAMDETVQAGRSDYVLLLDDDVVNETEGIMRAATFADLARTSTVVGGQMLSLYDRSVLHAFGETVARYRWFWGPAPHTHHGHNFANASLRTTPWLHRRVDVDYNGWWMCLIPTDVIRKVGLALPMFLKWDDAEFGLRCKAAGHPTVTLPGVAVWHVPWHEKDDTIDWQAYFHRRNRIAAGLLHSPYERGGRLVRESFETQVKHLVSMQYSPAEMGLMAIEDLLAGPERMHRDIVHRLGELRELRSRSADAQAEGDLESFPPVRRHKPPRRGKEPSRPRGRLGMAKTVARQAVPMRRTARRSPEANVPNVDLQWWLLAQFDSAIVSSADGTSAAWYQREPETFRALLARSISVHARLAREWPRLRERYRAALGDLTSPERWRDTFEASSPGPGQQGR